MWGARPRLRRTQRFHRARCLRLVLVYRRAPLRWTEPVVCEWHAAKAKATLQEHVVSSDDAATVLLDPLALTYPDPYHSGEEEREITIGRPLKNGSSSCRYEEGIGKEIG